MTARRLLAVFSDFWIDEEAPFCMISHRVIEIDFNTLYDGAAKKESIINYGIRDKPVFT